jgi:malate dehydrogenase
MTRKKVSILGAGKVGSTTAQLLAYRGICDVVLYNRTADTAIGIALDIAESAPIESFDVSIKGTGDFKDIQGSDVVVLTAGAQRKEGQSRDELLESNAAIVMEMCTQIKRYAPNSKLIVLTNPLDAMVYLAKKVTGFPKERVAGMAGILDSSRFRSFIAMELGIGVDSVSALVLGGHGDSMVPLPRHASVAGVPLSEMLNKEQINRLIQRTRDAGAEIIKLEKSSSFYAPASSLVTMVNAMLSDTKEVFPCAAYFTGEYKLNGIFMGVPVVLGANGVERIVELQLTKEERKAFDESAEKVLALSKQIDNWVTKNGRKK